MRSGWCGLGARDWQHDRCRLPGCDCPCHTTPTDTEPLLWMGDQA